MQIVTAALAGLVFGTGLVLAGFVNPAVVLGFLDIFGDWNPALLFGMAAALAVALPGYRLAAALHGKVQVTVEVAVALPHYPKGRRRKPLLASTHYLPTAREVDAPLVAGAAIFGVGWGLAGICPGPAVTLLGIAPLSIAPFLIAVVVGMLIVKAAAQAPVWMRRKTGQPSVADG